MPSSPPLSSDSNSKAVNPVPVRPSDFTVEIPLLVSSLEQAQQRMDGVYHELEGKLAQWEQQVKKYQEETKQLQQQLRRLGQKWKQAEDSKDKERYHQEFERVYHRYHMVLRYQESYLRMYQTHCATLAHIQEWRSILKKLHQPLEKFSPKTIRMDQKK